MKIGEIIQNITSIEAKGAPSDDSRLSARHVYSRMLITRASLLIQKQDKRKKISEASYQTINCLELIKAAPYECPCIPPVGCGIFRSKHKLPEPLVGMNTHLLQAVTSLDGSTTYSETTWIEKKYKSGNRYTSNRPDYYLRNGYLYVTADMMFNKILSVTGLFNRPEEVWDFEDHCNVDCVNCVDCTPMSDREFPLDANNIETLIKILKDEMLAFFVQMKEDRTSNSADNISEQSK
jgi:hypothetical protein